VVSGGWECSEGKENRIEPWEKQGIEKERKGKERKGGRERERHTRLYPGLLALVDDELLELLLVAVAHFAEVDVCADVVAKIHVGPFFEIARVRSVGCGKGYSCQE
jgi:hypothetical protein